ncbi:hypothetical protein ACU8KH_02569 [Lachancea thermotolerans]
MAFLHYSEKAPMSLHCELYTECSSGCEDRLVSRDHKRTSNFGCHSGFLLQELFLSPNRDKCIKITYATK